MQATAPRKRRGSLLSGPSTPPSSRIKSPNGFSNGITPAMSSAVLETTSSTNRDQCRSALRSSEKARSSMNHPGTLRPHSDACSRTPCDVAPAANSINRSRADSSTRSGRGTKSAQGMRRRTSRQPTDARRARSASRRSTSSCVTGRVARVANRAIRVTSRRVNVSTARRCRSGLQ